MVNKTGYVEISPTGEIIEEKRKPLTKAEWSRIRKSVAEEEKPEVKKKTDFLQKFKKGITKIPKKKKRKGLTKIQKMAQRIATGESEKELRKALRMKKLRQQLAGKPLQRRPVGRVEEFERAIRIEQQVQERIRRKRLITQQHKDYNKRMREAKRQNSLLNAHRNMLTPQENAMNFLGGGDNFNILDTRENNIMKPNSINILKTNRRNILDTSPEDNILSTKNNLRF